MLEESLNLMMPSPDEEKSESAKEVKLFEVKPEEMASSIQ